MIKLSASVLCADPLNMEEGIRKALKSGADWIHLDIMDGHFVPNLSFGPGVCAAIRRAFPEAIIDAHLMIEHPLSYAEAFRAAGADRITVHAECADDVRTTLESIRRFAKAGLSLKPATPWETVIPYANLCDMILVMTVEPGFGGQRFMPEQLKKVRELRKYGYRGIISVDGGINRETAAEARKAGVDAMVMGSALFRLEDPGELIRLCKGEE